MMTKEEALDKLIEYRKNGSSVPLYKFCDTIVYCSECPFSNENDECSEAMITGLIDRLIEGGIMND